MCLEIVCFTLLGYYYPVGITIAVALIYDTFAFLPQGICGELMTRFKKIPFGTIGNLCIAFAVFLVASGNRPVHYLGFFLLAVGNAFLHAVGAVATVATSEGKIFPSALFVSGGSFGLILGQTIGKSQAGLWFLFIPIVIIEIVLVITRKWREVKEYPEFRASVADLSWEKILFIAFIVTAIRSFIGYAIPMSWKTEVWQSFLLFFVMGLGKALGGWLTDKFGAKTVGVASTLVSIPFLILGGNNMVISVIGICIFSMTMSITFAMCLSVLHDHPGVAFGITTIALYAGSVPVFFIKLGSVENTILTVSFSVLCAALLFISTVNVKRT